MQHGFFDWQNRFEKLNINGDPLIKLNQVVPWESFDTGTFKASAISAYCLRPNQKN